MEGDDRDPAGADAAAPLPRVTRLYGSVDVENPPTLVDKQTTRAVTAPTPVVGSLLERYVIGDVLGQGGMGEVLSARDEQIGRPVAIKRLRVENPSPEIMTRFLREARIQGRLEHPAVVPVHELWTDGGQPFFVMKQLTGTTLADVIPRLALRDKRATEDFTLQRLLRAFADVCLAIEFAHTRRVVHRDLKPANIVLGDFGEVYVLDWGIARITEDTDHSKQRDSFGDISTVGAFADIGTSSGPETVVGAILGTPGYISPEQIRGDYFLDGRADVYSLGCILFEILALQPLHPRGQPGLASALAGVDARPSVRAPDREIPPELDRICVQSTQVDPQLRFDTARQLGDAVQHFLDGNRDIALRRELAKSELGAARHALSRGEGQGERRDALRAAARALALDPTDRESADIVAHLILDPPPELPSEVAAELDGLDVQALAKNARFGVLAAYAYLAFFPILYFMGFRELWYLIAGPAICLYIIPVAQLGPKRPFLTGYLGMAGHLAMFGLWAWMLSPIVIGPGPAIIMVTLLAQHRKLLRPWLVALFTWLTTLAPLFLAEAGVMPEKLSITGQDIVLHTSASLPLDPNFTLAGLVVYLIALIHLAALLSRLQDDDRRNVRTAMQLQSWQLRQLVPRPTSKPPRRTGSA
jgi:serine/threonine-protein kinase